MKTKYSRLEDELLKASIKEHGTAKGCRVAQGQIYQRCNIKRSIKGLEQRWYHALKPKAKSKVKTTPQPKATGGKNAILLDLFVKQVIDSLTYEQKKELINKYI